MPWGYNVVFFLVPFQRNVFNIPSICQLTSVLKFCFKIICFAHIFENLHLKLLI